MRHFFFASLGLLLGAFGLPQASAQAFVAVMGGTAALSSAASAQAEPPVASNYKPGVGPAFNAEIGYHLNDWFSVRGGYGWNQNRIVTTEVSGASFRAASVLQKQNAFSGELLLYFRPRKSWVRPYLTAGPAWVWFSSESKVGLRVAVGADLNVGNSGWGLRYSFSEVMSGNPFAAALTPSGGGTLMNFQNLFGVVKVF